MINEYYAKKFCKEDLSKIENYDKAIADTTKISESLKGLRKGKATSIFGRAFIEHFGITRSDDIKLYLKEYNFFKKNNKFSWDVNNEARF